MPFLHGHTLLFHLNIRMAGKSILCLVHSSLVQFCVCSFHGYFTLYIVILQESTQFLVGEFQLESTASDNPYLLHTPNISVVCYSRFLELGFLLIPDF